MNLVIDQGNTQTKIGIFEEDVLIHMDRYSKFGLSEIQVILQKYTISQAILSSVIGEDKDCVDYLNNKLEKFVVLNNETPLPIDNLYETPKTLGQDRIAVCVGANYLKPNKNLLIIDAGTAITYDIVNSKNQYVGGNISLGLDMRRNALHTFTQKLPLVELKDDIPLIGTTTENALLSGVVNGLVNEIDGFIIKLSNVYPNLLVFLTGGNANYFERKIKSRIFATQNLLLVGLNRILTFR